MPSRQTSPMRARRNKNFSTRYPLSPNVVLTLWLDSAAPRFPKFRGTFLHRTLWVKCAFLHRGLWALLLHFAHAIRYRQDRQIITNQTRSPNPAFRPLVLSLIDCSFIITILTAIRP